MKLTIKVSHHYITIVLHCTTVHSKLLDINLLTSSNILFVCVYNSFGDHSINYKKNLGDHSIPCFVRQMRVMAPKKQTPLSNLEIETIV